MTTDNHKCGQDMALDDIGDTFFHFHCKECGRHFIPKVENGKLNYIFMANPTTFNEQGMSKN